MKILLIAATAAEIALLTARIVPYKTVENMQFYRFGEGELDICITGVGMVATSYWLTKMLIAKQYDLVLQAGIAGAFNKEIEIGELVLVTSEQWGDMGAEDHAKRLDIFEMGLVQENEKPFAARALLMPVHKWENEITLRRVKGITVNTVSGNEETISRLKQHYGAEVESMEGAALHYVCLQEAVDFMQIRAISNYVEPRDKSKWQMPLAIDNLNKWLIDFFSKIYNI